MKTTVDGFNFSEDDYLDDILQDFTSALKTFGISVSIDYDEYTGEGYISLLKADNLESEEKDAELFDITVSLSKAKYNEFLRVLGISKKD